MPDHEPTDEELRDFEEAFKRAEEAGTLVDVTGQAAETSTVFFVGPADLKMMERLLDEGASGERASSSRGTRRVGEFVVCSKCFDLRGTCGDLQQRCDCDADLRSNGSWDTDLQRCLELCRCCGAVPLASGSRWSVWFCRTCERRVRRLNDAVGFALIPLGRHSLMHGLRLRNDPTYAEEHAFAAAFDGLVGRMELLESVARGRVEENVRTLAFAAGHDVPLDAYVAAAIRLPLRKLEGFAALGEVFLRPDQAPI